MKNLVKEFIHKNTAPGILFVLKGFSIEELGLPRSVLEQIVENKISRLVSLIQQENQIISFDEFICLYDLVLAQYRKIFILENNLYLNLFPINAAIPDEIITALLNHFDNDVETNVPIGDLSEYTNIYSNFVETDFGQACCYNLDDGTTKHEKIERCSFGQGAKPIAEVNDSSGNLQYVALCNDIDYYQLVQQLKTTNKRFALTWENYLSGKERMQKKLLLLSAEFDNRVFAYLIPTISPKGKSNHAALDILNKYWGYEDFRDIKIYDLNEAENKRKKVATISQEDIICDLIEQVEHCVNRDNFRDVFVTAPTGAGKSLMFQIPAIYLAEKFNLVTLVVTPLIGLMNDQIQALTARGYHGARTINSDISPIIKQEILDEIANGSCHILYLSPESLLSRSDIEQLIGSRKIGMLVVDEAHIVTTWGKQFRPDYWYLGDHVQKLRRAQSRRECDPSPFIIATFTATAIYEGKEDMYHETINSLHMIDPITYLGYVRRENISIEISEVEVKRNKVEYEINKFDALISLIKTALIRNQKTLIYFPTVALINRFHDYCNSKNLGSYVAKYHGQMDATAKDEGFRDFLSGKKMIMLATKAFGMGIDIPNIAIVSHFAPTGNVCDYMQEIGRAARKIEIEGHAIYKYMNNDFKHINRLHGLSAIQKYQLVEVIKKVLEIYTNSRYQENGCSYTKMRNEILVDAESFGYIFESPQSDENELISKVKTAMLLIQKDYENRGFAPFYMRPIPMFAYGFFAAKPYDREHLNRIYHDACELIDPSQNVCKVNLKRIWEQSYQKSMSFPKFKYLLYTNSAELDFNQKYALVSAMSVEIFFEDDGDNKFQKTIKSLKSLIHPSLYQGSYIPFEEMNTKLAAVCSISRYKAENIVSVILAAMNIYQRDYSERMNARMYSSRVTKDSKVSYSFSNATLDFFTWITKGYNYIKKKTDNQKLYIVNDQSKLRCKETTTMLGVLESMGVLRFKSLGGSHSQIYIYVNETKNMQIVRDRPQSYRNQLLEMVNIRHQDSVQMLTYLFQNQFTSEEIWDHLENYFLGILPIDLNPISSSKNNAANIQEISIQLLIGENLINDYSSWQEANEIFDNDVIASFDGESIPMADYYASKLVINETEINAQLVWQQSKIVISDGEETEDMRSLVQSNGWFCIPVDSISVDELRSLIQE